MKHFTIAVLVVAVLAVANDVAAQELYRDEMTSGAGWGKNDSPDLDSAATFGYDYSADGIPEAPNSRGGDAVTSGVKLEANNGDAVAVAAYFTLYPVGQNFTGDYQLRFDQWQNYDVVEFVDGGAVGTTEFAGGGIGYDDVTADVASGAQAISTGDGGSSNDWRAFKSPPQFFIQDAAMTAGTHEGSDLYYADFLPGVEPPGIQGQTGPNAPYFGTSGSPGFQWITWEFNVVGNDVSIYIEKPNGDRLEIVSYDKTDTSDGSSGVSTDGNISIFYADFFTSVTPRPDLTFGIVDNVVVTALNSFAEADFDQDGDVDGDDFLAWQGGFGTASGAMKSDGDYDNDGDVDGDDFLGWQSEFGSGDAAGTVPEPSAVVLLLVGLALGRFAIKR